MRSVALLSLFVAVVFASLDAPALFPNAEAHWREFVTTYQKAYTPEEAAVRFRIFKDTLLRIDMQNTEHPTATFGINKFADLTPNEFSSMYLMPNFKSGFTGANYQPVAPSVEALPISFDWRDKNAVTPVKDQGQCGSCWAFSATEEIESQWILKGNAAVELSPQQIVDCDKNDLGCSGGDTPTAYEYVIKAGGLEAEVVYPYKAKDQKCHFNSTGVAVKISQWQYVVKGKNETEMQNSLYVAGPLSICVDADPWQTYQKGILTKKCGQDLDHCVLLVGYGVDSSSNLEFWSIRNSWGTDWGEDGYIRVARNNKNLCGVADEVTIAVI